MRRPLLTAWLLLVPLLAAGGCPKQGQDISVSMEWLLGPSGKKLGEMATDKDDADRRRQGIDKIADKDWGRREPYLAWYADCLQKDKYATVRCAAARALAKCHATGYLPVLIAALNDPSPVVRCDVAVALEHFRGEEPVDPLRKTAAEDHSPDVRAAAAKTLRYYPFPRVPPTLVYCLSDDAFDVRSWAHDSLAVLTGKDLGWEPGDWKPVVGANVPLHGPQWHRPWWDWFGRTRPQEPPSPAASRPASAPAPGPVPVPAPVATPPPASAPAK